MVSDMSEPLGEDEGHGEIAEDEDADDQADEVLGTHGRSTPFRISRMRTKSAAVTTR